MKPQISKLLTWNKIVFKIEETDVEVNCRDKKTWANQGKKCEANTFLEKHKFIEFFLLDSLFPTYVSISSTHLLCCIV